MVATSNVVSLSISVRDTSVRTQSFGTPGILAWVVGNFWGVQEYALTPTGLAAMVTDGFATTDAAYLMASALASQSPSPDTVKIYARRSSELNQYTFTPTTPKTGDVYTMNLEAATVSYTAVAGDTVATVIDGLLLAATAAGVTSATLADNTTDFTVTSNTLGGRLRIRTLSSNLEMADTSTAVGEIVNYGETVELTPDAADGTYNVTVYGGDGSVNVSTYTASSDTATAICDDLRSDLGTISGLTIGGTDTLTLAPTAAGDICAFSFSATGGAAFAVTPSKFETTRTITDDLVEAVVSDADFYGFGVDTGEADTIALVAAWAESNKHPYYPCVNDAECADNAVSSDVISTLQTSNYHYTQCYVTRDQAGYLSMAMLGIDHANDPGSYTLANKQPSGPQVDTWTETQFSTIQSKGGCSYVPLGRTGQNVTFDGWAVSGRYTDLTRGTDWLEAQIEAACVAALIADPRIPFTQKGLDKLGGVIQGELLGGVDQGFISGGPQPPDGEGPVTTIPSISDFSASERATRFADGFTFQGVFQGAIHSIDINGTLSTGS